MIISSSVEQDIIYTIESDGSENLVSWVGNRWQELQKSLYQYGAILLRNFDMDDGQLANLLSQCNESQLQYLFRSTPRTTVSDKIYTTTEYPEDRTILQHNENAYSNHWPKRLWFHCVIDNFEQGQTPLTSSKAVYAALPSEIKDEFATRKLRYERNFNPFIDLHWQDVFCTDNKSEVEAYCLKNNIEFTWSEKGLSTTQICDATQTHPVTEEQVWFNQAHIFHPHSQGEEFIQLLKTCGVAPPRNVRFADNGDEIPGEVIQLINDIYTDLSVSFDWKKRDVLIIDNLLVAHGRRPFQGSRKILVAMSN